MYFLLCFHIVFLSELLFSCFNDVLYFHVLGQFLIVSLFCAASYLAMHWCGSPVLDSNLLSNFSCIYSFYLDIC